MIPIRAVSEGMGMTVDWNADTKTVTIGNNRVEQTISFVIGSETATITASSGGSAEAPTVAQFTMDCAPYIDGGRTMVPVRFLSEALGYTVLWDSDFRTVVVADPDALISHIDEKFTQFNRISAQQRAGAALGASLKVAYNMDGSLTLYDETGKASAYPFGLDCTAATDSHSFRIEMTLDLSGIADAVKQNPALLADAELPVKDLLAVDWSKVTATLLLDETGHCWMNAPVLNTLLLNVGPKVWLDMGGLNELAGDGAGSPINLEALMNLPEDATIGQIILAMTAVDENAFYFDETVASATALLEAFYGDSVASGSDTSCTWTMDPNKVLDCLGLTREDLLTDDWTVDLTGKTTMDTAGNTSMRGDLRMTSDLFSTITGSLNATGRPNDATVTLKAAMADLFDLTLTVKCTAEPLDKLPSFELSEGAEVLDFSSLMESGEV